MLEELTQVETFRKFNQVYKEYQKVKSDEIVNLINRYLAMISTIMDPKFFDPLQKDVCLFYINIYELLSTMDAQSTIFWSVTAVLENVMNISRGKILSEKFRYLPPLVKLLEQVVDKKTKINKLLIIIQNLTVNIRLTWDEPWLRPLISQLVKNICADEESVIELAASVLLNVCYKNPHAVHCLSYERDSFEIVDRLKKNRALKFKLQYILHEPESQSFDLDAEVFMEAIFKDVEAALTHWDHYVLKHIVSFVSDIVMNHSKYIQQCETCADKIGHTLDLLMNSSERSDNSLKCFGEFLLLSKELISFFMGTMRFSTLSKLFKFSLDLCHEQGCFEAYSAIEVLLKEEDLLKEKANQQLLFDHLPELLMILDLPGGLSDAPTLLSSFFKMLLSLVEVVPLRNILNKVDAVCFNGFICQLHSYSLTQAIAFGKEEVDMIVFGLRVIYTFAESQITSWKLQLDRALQFAGNLKLYLEKLFNEKCAQFEAVHVCLMKVIKSKEIGAVKFSLQLIQLESLPVNALATVFARSSHMDNTSTFVRRKQEHIGEPAPYIQSSELLFRVEDAVDKILNGSTRDEVQEISIVDILDLFQYKLSMCKSQELYLLHQIQEAADEATFLRHQNALIESKMNEIRDESHNFRLTRKKFEGEKVELVNQINNLKTQIEGDKEEINVLKLEKKELKKIINEKDGVIGEVNEELNCLVDIINIRDATVKSQILTIQDHEQAIASLRKQISQLETMRNQLHTKINDKNCEIEDAEVQMKALDDENQSLIQKIGELQKQLDEKNHIIAEHEADLMEIERMKSRVIAIVQKKKDDEAAKEAEIKSAAKEVVSALTTFETKHGGGDRAAAADDDDNDDDDDDVFEIAVEEAMK